MRRPGTRQPCSYCHRYAAHTTSNCPSERAKADRAETRKVQRELGLSWSSAKYVLAQRRKMEAR